MKWEMKTIDQLGNVSRGRSRHRPRDAAFLYGGDIPFIQTSEVKHANLYITTFDQTYSEAGLAQSRLWKSGTLCITIAANIADTAILGIDACFPDSIIGFIPDPKLADVRFIKYLFDATLQKRYKTFTQGVAQDNLSQEKLLSLKFPVPRLSVQTKIADILSTYDSLIENNRRRIKLLEESARLLYKEWFVHFRFPGHEHIRIVDGVPEGWEKKNLGDFVAINKGKLITKETTICGDIPVVAGGLEPAYYHNQANAMGHIVTISASGANSGYVNLYLEDIWASDCSYFTKESTDAFFYFYYLLKYRQSEVFGFQVGAAQPHVYPKDIMRMSAVRPSSTILRAFESITDNFFRNIKNLKQSNQKLSKGRDLLLPRLMNGEIEV